MGVNIRHEDEHGKMLEELLDPHSLLNRIVPQLSNADSACLRFIDLCGDTVFNQLQIPFLIAELELAMQQQTDPQVRAQVKSILNLARRAETKGHTYLKFYGD